MMTIKEPVYRLVGKRIAEAREAKGLSQLELTKQLQARGVTIQRTSITHIERGVQRVMLHSLYDIAGVLGVSIGKLLPQPDEVASTATTIAPDAPGSDWVLRVVAGDSAKKGRKKNVN
jgi:transcriptional regulator with XRE-family HTH domain